jgi:hypothetical protein
MGNNFKSGKTIREKNETGVHKPANKFASDHEGVSNAGEKVRSPVKYGMGSQAEGKMIHKQNLNQLKDMPKPNLPKAEGKDKQELNEKPQQPEQNAPEQSQSQPAQGSFLSFDGDSIGSKIGQATLHDDVEGVKQISGKISAGGDLFSKWVQANGGEVIEIGGDEGTAQFPSQIDPSQVEEFRSQYSQVVGATATVGTGSKLSEASKALIFGKLNGKNKTVPYDPSVEEFLQNAHNSAASGNADEETQKQNNAYLNDMGEEVAEDAIDHPHEDAPEHHLAEDGQPEGDINPEDASMENDQIETAADEQESSNPSEESEDEGYFHNMGAEGEENPEDPAQEVVEGKIPVNDPKMNEPLDEAEGEENPEDENPMEDQSSPEDDNAIEEDMGDYDDGIPVGDLSDEDSMDENPEDPSISGTIADSMNQGNGDYLKAKMMELLNSFKQDKEFIEQAQQSSPELYQETISLLHQMIKVAKMLNGSSDNQQDPNSQQPQEQGGGDYNQPVEDNTPSPKQQP